MSRWPCSNDACSRGYGHEGDCDVDVERIRAEAKAEGAAEERERLTNLIISTVGGAVEGHPTSSINYLQRLRALVAYERSPHLLEAERELSEWRAAAVGVDAKFSKPEIQKAADENRALRARSTEGAK